MANVHVQSKNPAGSPFHRVNWFQRARDIKIGYPQSHSTDVGISWGLLPVTGWQNYGILKKECACIRTVLLRNIRFLDAGMQKPLWSCDFHDFADFFVVSGSNQLATVYDAGSLRIRQTLRGHCGDVNCVNVFFFTVSMKILTA